MISTNTTNWCSALPGVELGLLWSDFAALTTWLQICGSYDHSTEYQTPHLTHEVSPYLRFSLPPSSVILANALLPSRPSFQPKPWTCFTTNDRTRCHLRPTPILNGYILPSRSRTLAGAIINNQLSLDIAQLGLPSIPSHILNHTFTTSAVITPH